MLLKRFDEPKLAQVSYLVGCAATGEALVIDPNRDIDQYVEAAEAEGFRISHVTETHIHADFVSGSRELAHRTGARLYLSDEGGPEWRYEFATEAGAVLLRDGDTFQIGRIEVEVVHTPGHTPEHLCFMITDTAATDRPMGVFTGDFVFVGDVGRPDLLERAARVEGAMEAGGRALYRSLQAFKSRPDFLQLWPGHGAGSACGKSLGAVPQSTLGYERVANWGLQQISEDEFLQRVVEGQPEPPRYFAEMKRINRMGPPLLDGHRRPPLLPADAIVQLMGAGALVIDTRAAGAFALEHVPGTLNIPLDRTFNTWAGWLVPYDRDVHLLVENEAHLDEAVRDLAIIGLDRIAGYLRSEALGAWTASGRLLETIPQMNADELARARKAGLVNVLDVRGASEWESGHMPDVSHVPLGDLPERMGDVPGGRPLVVHCQSGARSAIAASMLQSRGIQVINLLGGFGAWRRAGHPVERDGVDE